jgi:hypothetical protein
MTSSGFLLLIGLTAGGRAYAPISIFLGVQLVIALALLEWIAGFGLVGGSAELARDYGALPATLSLLAGAFAILSRATAERLREGGSSS